MKRYTILLIAGLLHLGAFAQDGEAMKKIESARIALITERLDLTPDQAEKFWPVYREYNEERRQLRQEFRETRRSADQQSLSEEESKQLMERALDLKQREVNLDKKYSERMTQVISTQQLLKLRNAEKDFQQMLLRRIQQQRERQNQNQKMMQRREMLRDRNNN